MENQTKESPPPNDLEINSIKQHIYNKNQLNILNIHLDSKLNFSCL